MPPDPGRWFVETSVTADAERLLFCFPHGGAGVSAYRGWQSALGEEVGVLPAMLPGRESRSREEPVRAITELSDALVDPLTACAGRREIFLFGHSMGALIAYEVAHALQSRGRAPSGLIVSGAVAPHRTDPATPIHHLPDEAFLEHVTALEGIPEAVLREPSLLEMVLPVLRADFEACETYVWRERPPLGVPVAAIGGAEDPRATADELKHWGELTTGAFHRVLLPGGHFYLSQEPERFLGVLHGFLGDMR